MKYEIVLTTTFKKKLKLMKKRNKNMKKLTEVVNLLAEGNTLDRKYKDHVLISNLKFKECRECHIEPDWLLVYKIIR